jgi:hypothetical protein
MAVIKSGASTDQMTVDATSKAARITLYDTAGTAISTAAGTALRVALYDASGNAVSVDSNALRVSLYDSGGTAFDVTAKGTQAANALGVQKLSDAGRVIQVWYAVNFTPTTSEALVTLTPATDGTVGSTGTSFTVTSGKKLRLVSLMMSLNCASTTAVGGTCWLVVSASGAVTTSSSHCATVGCGLVGTQTAQNGAGQCVSLGEGLELSGSMQLGITAKGINAAGFNVAVLGYEY